MLRASRPYLCLLFLMVVGCMRTGERGTGTSREPLHDIITLELTFGAENVSEDFMLVRPSYQGIALDLAGDVLVVDEDFIKVFDSAGNEQKLLGGPGEGPGEFSRVRDIWMSPEGYYTVFGGQFGFTANYFQPDHSYIERVNYMSTRPFMGIMDANDLIPERPEFIFCLGEAERIYSIGGRDKDRNNRQRKEIYLFYETADTLRVIAHHPQSNYVSGPPRTGAYGWDNLGKLLFAPLPGQRIVYLHSWHDSERTPDICTYRLRILDLRTMEESHIVQEYEQEEIVWEPPEYDEEFKERNPDQWERTQQLNKVAEEFLAERQYKASLIRLHTDGRYIFAFTNTENDSGHVKVDVFDGDRIEYLCSAWFPFSGGLFIRDGYLYRVNSFYAEETYPVIEKHRIDSRVYGSRR